MEGTNGQDERKRRNEGITTIRVKRETHQRLTALARRLHLTYDDAIRTLLDAFTNAQQFKGSAYALEKPEKESPQALAQSISQRDEARYLSEKEADAIKETRIAILWLLEPIIDALDALIAVYPDLRVEMGLHLEALRQRASQVAEMWLSDESDLEPSGTPIDTADTDGSTR
jgi:antitoxin component of RelBE/YafQ-DinJ toxin-antitoxin module